MQVIIYIHTKFNLNLKSLCEVDEVQVQDEVQTLTRKLSRI